MEQIQKQISYKLLFSLPVIVAALGYFVDVYDLVLFGIVRVKSLMELGFTELETQSIGGQILNWQMGGLLLGGIIWGVLGDKKGRLAVLFGSILIYSLSNIACGFLPYLPKDKEFLTTTYIILRFIAGIGLAGELGAGITLVAEILPKELRAIGTSIVAGFGLSGAVFANLTYLGTSENWSLSYFIGGGMGLCLLFLRVGVLESGIFSHIKESNISRGNFLLFFTNYKRMIKYLKCIAIGIPTWFCIGILAMKADEFGLALGIKDIKPGDAIMWGYVGISVGDLFSGFLSHWLKSRRWAIFWMIFFTSISVIWLLTGNVHTKTMYYVMCVWFGFGTGYWAMFVTLSAEQFGTNIRSTATTTIPNFVRGTVIFMTLLFNYLKDMNLNVLNSALIVGVIVFSFCLISLFTSEETHGRDLDFLE